MNNGIKNEHEMIKNSHDHISYVRKWLELLLASPTHRRHKFQTKQIKKSLENKGL